MPLIQPVEQLAEYLDRLLTNTPDWDLEPIENSLCDKLAGLNELVGVITKPPEKFSMKDYIQPFERTRGAPPDQKTNGHPRDRNSEIQGRLTQQRELGRHGVAEHNRAQRKAAGRCSKVQCRARVVNVCREVRGVWFFLLLLSDGLGRLAPIGSASATGRAGGFFAGLVGAAWIFLKGLEMAAVFDFRDPTTAATACHEAGHFAAAAILSLPCESIVLYDRRSGVMSHPGSLYSEFDEDEFDRFMAPVALAGPVAECLYMRTRQYDLATARLPAAGVLGVRPEAAQDGRLQRGFGKNRGLLSPGHTVGEVPKATERQTVLARPCGNHQRRRVENRPRCL